VAKIVVASETTFVAFRNRGSHQCPTPPLLHLSNNRKPA
jgi:hypothetical protein